MQLSDAWQPSATIATLRERAALFKRIRAFFDARDVLEVDTPILARYGVTDPHLANLTTELAQSERKWFLQTSPEYAMKRLLAAGSGDIYQLGKVFRDDEQSRRHNAEFTLLEWYRVGFSAEQLIAEVDALLQEVVQAPPLQVITYQKVFQTYLQIDPLAANAVAELQASLAKHATLKDLVQYETDSDTLQQLAMAFVIEPALPPQQPIMITNYPASQAALATISSDDPRTAQRFELFWCGLELANGYHELVDADEQAKRFEHDRALRRHHQQPDCTPDARLLAALQHGMPACSGIAMGVDRLLMAALEIESITQVLPFDIARA